MQEDQTRSKDVPWLEAIVEVLEALGKPSHYADISDEIAKRGLRTKMGATPASTVNVTINNSIKRNPDGTPFERVDTGVYALRRAAATPGKPTEKPVPGDAAQPSETGGIIQALGMFWKRDWVGWSSRPRLIGQQQEGAKEVDFGEQRGVYLLHDGREVIYMGRTTEKRIGVRLAEHTRDRLNGRWDRFSWFGLLGVEDDGRLIEVHRNALPDEDIIVTLEAVLIEGLEPGQNRKRGDAFRPVEYIQVEDPEVANTRLLSGLKEKLTTRR